MMIFGEEKPDLNDLVHFGVKGMRWGVHKKEETGSGRDSGSAEKSTSDRKTSAQENATTKEYMAIKDKPRSKEAAAKELAKNNQKFLAKTNPTGANQKGGLTDKQKALLKVGIGVAAVGGLILYAKYSDNKRIAQIREMAGKRIGAAQFKDHVEASKWKTWGFGGFIQDSSYTRSEFSLPVGHEFHRIATSPEKDFSLGTYSVHSIEDFHRYIAGFRGEKIGVSDFHHVTWTAKEEIKVPNLTTVLETMRETWPGMTKESAKSTYQSWSGGTWGSSGDHKKFFDALTTKGYGAIVDEMDAGVIGETPLVFFGKHLVSEKKSVPFADNLIDIAENSLIEITNRKL